ncbi:MAG: TetR/AcrR family transcriptional regulator [Acidimicrobiia bacterium]|nr:TetR/AcrR family transcriptional regulator [Acidimicrobiia bacterium]
MSDSRAELLNAAWQIVVESFGFDDPGGPPSRQANAKILDQLKAADIAARAGMTTGAFYNRWPNREAFLDDFLDYALSVDRSPTFAALTAAFERVRGLDYVQQTLELGRIDIEMVASNPSFAIQTHLWSLMRSRTDIGDRMRTMYADFRSPLIPVYEAVLAGLGRELRPPFTMDQLANLLNALSEGLTMQVVTGGEGAPHPDLMGLALIALLPGVTRPIGDDRDLFDLVESELDSG